MHSPAPLQLYKVGWGAALWEDSGCPGGPQVEQKIIVGSGSTEDQQHSGLDEPEHRKGK